MSAAAPEPAANAGPEGTSAGGAATTGPPPARPTAATVSTVAATAGTLASAASMTATVLPWTTVRGSQPLDAREIAARMLPTLASTLPRPNLRWPALSILVTVAADVAVALLRGGPIAWPLLAVRVATGLLTATLGLAAGPAGGVVRTLTALASVAFGIAQVVSLAVGALGVAAAPSQLVALLPALVTALSGLVLSVTTAIGAWRR